MAARLYFNAQGRAVGRCRSARAFLVVCVYFMREEGFRVGVNASTADGWESLGDGFPSSSRAGPVRDLASRT